MSVQVCIQLDRGDTWTITFTLFSDKKMTIPANITGWQFRFLLFQNDEMEDGPYLMNVGSMGSVVPSGALISADGPNGVVKVVIPCTATALDPDQYSFNFKGLVPGSSPADERLLVRGYANVTSGANTRV